MQLLDFGQIESKERIFDLFPDTDKFTFDPFIRTLCFRRIIEANMQLLLYISLKYRTSLAGMITNGNHIVPRFVDIFRYIRRYVMTNVYTCFLHDFDSHGIYFFCRMGSSRKYF